MSRRAAVHLAVPVDDLVAARGFHGRLPGPSEGRGTDHRTDWNLEGRRPVTPSVPVPPRPTGTGPVGHHRVPVPRFGPLLGEEHSHRLAGRLRATGVRCGVEPDLRFPGGPGERRTVSFRDGSMVSAR